MSAPIDQAEIDRLLPYCLGPGQIELLDAIAKSGSVDAGIKLLGRNWRSSKRSLANIRSRANRATAAPTRTYAAPLEPGLKLSGTSDLYRPSTGEHVLSWVKTGKDEKQVEALIAAYVESMCEEIKGGAKPVKPPKESMEDIMVVYPMGDPHFGMYAWAEECGDNFDLKRAEELTCGAINNLVESVQPAQTALLINLGDFFHADNNSARTPQSGNALDVDTRHEMVMRVGLRAMVYCIGRLLRKHARVEVWMMPGNHDPHAGPALALALWSWYHNEPRVHIAQRAGDFRYREFGRVLIGAHHGHGPKMHELPGVMAANQGEAWGRTKHRYWYCGHVHHRNVDKEFPGCVVETFRTLAARDAYHASKGYFAGRDMVAITLHKQHGEILRSRCDFETLRDSALEAA